MEITSFRVLQQNRGLTKYEKIQDIFFLLYFCAWNAHCLTTPLDSAIRYSTFAMCCAIAAFAIVKRKKLVVNGFLRWLWLFLAYYTLSKLWARSSADASLYDNTFTNLFGITLCLSIRIKKRDDIDTILQLLVCSLLYMSILLVVKSPASDWGTTKIGSSLGLWKNNLGIRASVGTVLAGYLLTTCSKNKMRLINIVAIVILGAISIVSGSRKALLLIPCVFVLVFLFYIRQRHSAKDFAKIVGIIILAVILSAYIINFIFTNKMLYKAIGIRIEAVIGAFFKGEAGDGSIIERNYFIKRARELFSENMLFGYGANGFYTYMREINFSHIAYSHNNFWELLSTTGIIGFVLFYYMQFKLTFILFPKNKYNNILRMKNSFLWSLNVVIIIFGYWFSYVYDTQLIILFMLMYMNYKTQRVEALGRQDY